MSHSQDVARGLPPLQYAEHRKSQSFNRMRFVINRVLLVALVHASIALSAFATCTAPRNPIEAENCLPGTPASQWYVDGAGSPNIQGFPTDISVNAGQTISFKISTNAISYRIDIYRLGYYQGNDGRLVASISPSVSLPQIQPPCLTDSSTGLTDCGNWAISASWTVPSTAMSGIYFAKLTRLDTGEASPIIFVVRNDSSHSDILVQTSDTTWQAYNDYGGNSLYVGNPVGRAYKVSYNRPVNTLKDFFSNENNMLHWLEANGYDVSYSTGVDTDRNGALISQHRVFMSVGHDEYWSGGQRANVEAARDAGVNLAFFSGNEIFWKTRWEPSIEGSNTPYRTLVCYKETLANAVIDPADPPTWTGLWRDPRFSPPADGDRPENSLSGTIFAVDAPRNDPINVPQADGRMRFWRNTSMATLGPGQVATLPTGVLGYEWDIDADNGFRPAGLIRLSTTTLPASTYLYYSPSSGYYFGNANATHHLTLYRAPSGALVFAAGTIHWSAAVENDHGGFSGVLADPNAKQATVNLLADMGVQPATLQSGLTPATASTDTTPPRSAITSPAPGSTVAGSPVTISGTAVDFGGGVVGAVEVSLDGGKTWHPAAGRENWSYTFTPGSSGTLSLQSRAVDDSGNLEVSSPGSGFTINSVPQSCPCTIWPATAAPTIADAGPYSPLELGVQFRADTSGYVTGIRFYKSAANTGTHVGNLWSSSGALLASATFTGESASGWQQVSFSNPVAVTANTVYVASYHTTVGHFSEDQNYFATSGVDNAPLHALADGGGGANGVYAFATTSTFPANNYSSSNFWVDVVFNFNAGGDSPLSVTTSSLPNGTQSVAYNQTLAAVGGTAPYGWSLFSGTLPPGLTLSTSGLISRTPTTVATSNFTAQVTDSSTPVQTATQALSITVVGPVGSQNNAELNGNYAFTLSGASGSGGGSAVFAAVGRFTADGAGNLTNGELDTNGVGAGAVLTAQSFAGTYAIGADNRGVMTLSISGGTTKLAFAMMANGNAKFIEFDAAGGAGTIGSGTMEKVDTTAYNTARIAGDYVFGAAGLDNSNNRAAIAGRFTSNGTGTLTNAAGDVNAYGSVNSMNFTAANYTVSNTATGRGTMNLAFLFGGTSASLNLVFYVVNAGKMFAMERDAVTTATPLLNGVVVHQQIPTGGFSNASLNGNMVIHLTGLSMCGSGAGVPKAGAGLLTANGSGAFSLTYDENYCRAPNSFTAAPGTYSVASNGRTSITIGGFSLVAYLVSLNQVFLFVSDSNVLFGFGEPQAPGSFTNSAVTGTYAGFSATPATFGVVPFSGEFIADGASPTGSLTGTEDIGAASGPNPGVAFNATYSVSSSSTNGRGTMTVTSGSGGSAVVYVISPSKFVVVPLNDPNPAVLIFEQSSPTPTLSSLTLNPSSVTGGNFSTGTVTLNAPAPSGGAIVSLSSSNTSVATVPSSVTVAGGATSAAFTVSTNQVGASTSVTISASYGGVAQTASLTVSAQPNYTLSTSPTSLSIAQGTSGTSTITVTPHNGFSSSVSLSASGLPSGVTASFSPNPATMTSTLTLAASNTATTATVTVTITGTSGSLTNTTTITLTVTPPPLPTVSSLTLNPTSVIGGTQSSTGTVTLSGPAPAGGAQVLLSSSNGAASVPSSVTVPAGATSVTFTVNTSIVLLSTSANISASYNGTTKTATLGVLL